MTHIDLRGYYYTPVSLALTYLCGGLTVMLQMLKKGEKNLAQLEKLSDITQKFEIWRIFTSHLAFEYSGSALIGLFLIYHGRFAERQLGSKKFGAFLFLIWFISVGIQIALLSLQGQSHLASGPFPFIFAILVIFYERVPRLQPKLLTLFRRIHFSDKSLTYILSLVLLYLNGRPAFIPSIIGLIVGQLYLANRVPLQSFRLPGPIVSLLSALHPLFEVTPPSVLNRRIQQRRQQQLQRLQQQMAGMGGEAGLRARQGLPPAAQARAAANTPATAPRPATAANAQGGGAREQLLPGGDGWQQLQQQLQQIMGPPSEEAIQSLTSLGFEREQAIRALQASGNNVEAAANRLLSQ